MHASAASVRQATSALTLSVLLTAALGAV